MANHEADDGDEPCTGSSSGPVSESGKQLNRREWLRQAIRDTEALIEEMGTPDEVVRVFSSPCSLDYDSATDSGAELGLAEETLEALRRELECIETNIRLRAKTGYSD